MSRFEIHANFCMYLIFCQESLCLRSHLLKKIINQYNQKDQAFRASFWMHEQGINIYYIILIILLVLMLSNFLIFFFVFSSPMISLISIIISSSALVLRIFRIATFLSGICDFSTMENSSFPNNIYLTALWARREWGISWISHDVIYRLETKNACQRDLADDDCWVDSSWSNTEQPSQVKPLRDTQR